MSKIAIVTDSTADIPKEAADALGIRIVPLTLHTKMGSFLDRETIQNKEMFDYLRTTDTLPTTSQPAPSAFLEVYEALAGEGVELIYSLHISKDLSGTINSASMASALLDPKVRVKTIDSRTATLGLGLIVIEGAKRLKDGADEATLDAYFQEAIASLKIYFLLDSLEHLEKGGRIGKASYLVGSLLNIKPLLVLSDGVIAAHKKIRGNNMDRARKEIIACVKGDLDPDAKVTLAIGYNDQTAAADALAALLEKEMGAKDVLRFELGSVVSTHIGLGAQGIAFFQERSAE